MLILSTRDEFLGEHRHIVLRNTDSTWGWLHFYRRESRGKTLITLEAIMLVPCTGARSLIIASRRVVPHVGPTRDARTSARLICGAVTMGL